MGVPVVFLGYYPVTHDVMWACRYIMTYVMMYVILCQVDTLTTEMRPITPTWLMITAWGLLYASIAITVHKLYDYLIVISIRHEFSLRACAKVFGRVIMRHLIMCAIILQMMAATAVIRPATLTWWQVPWIIIVSATGFTFVMSYEQLVEWIAEREIHE